MKKNGYLHRLIALIMTAAMLLTLVTIDNRYDTAAESETESTQLPSWSIDLTDEKFEAYPTDEEEVIVKNEDITVFSVPVNSKAVVSGCDYMFLDVASDAIDEDGNVTAKAYLASKDKLKEAKEIKQDITDETTSYTYAVYEEVPEEETTEDASTTEVASEDASTDEETEKTEETAPVIQYVLVGVIQLTGVEDEDAPVIGNGTITVETADGEAKYSINDDADEYANLGYVKLFRIDGLTADENNSPVDAASVTIDGEALSTAGKVSDNKYDFNYASCSSDGLGSGEHEVIFTATNRMGKTAKRTFTFTLDVDKPEVSLPEASEDNIYVVTNEKGKALSFMAKDVLSGIKATKATVNGELCDVGENNTIDYTFREVGSYTVKITAEDKAGNSTTETYTVYVDNGEITSKSMLAHDGKRNEYTDEKTEAAITYVGGENVSFAYSVTGYDIIAEDVTASVTRTDADGKETKIEEPTPTTETTTDGLTTLKFTYNLAGNGEGTYAFSFDTVHHYSKESGKSDTMLYVYDKSAPTNTTVEFLNKPVTLNNIYYYSAAQTPQIQIMAEDNFALGSYKVTNSTTENAVKEATIGVDDSSEKKLSETIGLPSGVKDIVYEISFYAEDKAGNGKEGVDKNGVSLQYAIDSTAPQVKITNEMSGEKLTSYWNQERVMIRAVATDEVQVTKVMATATRDGMPIESQQQDVNNTSGGASFTYTTPGKYVVTIIAYDEVENASDAQTCEFVIDQTKPDITFEGIPANGLYVNDGAHPLTIKVTDDYGIDAADVTVKEVYETYDGTKGEKILEPMTDSESGAIVASVDSCVTDGDKPMKYYFTVSAKDKTGNTDTKESSVFYSDTMKPAVTITPEIAGDHVTHYYNSAQTFDIHVKEQFALGATVYVLDTDTYEKSGKTASDYKTNALQTFTLSDKTEDTFQAAAKKAGTYNWTVVVVDAFGNTAVSGNLNFVIDLTAPKAEITGVPENGRSTGTDVSIVITDNEIIDTTDFKIVQCYKYHDATEYVEHELQVTQVDSKTVQASVHCGKKGDKACSYYFKVTGTDKAGNAVEYDVDASRFKVDTTNPGITLDPDPAETNDGYYNKNVSFKFTVTEDYGIRTKITVTDKNKEKNGDADETYTLKETSGTYEVTRSKAGTYDLTITVVDAFGNINTERVKFVIDKEAPVAEIGGVPEDKKTTGTTVVITITDNKLLELKDFKVTQCYKYFDSDTYIEKEVTMKQKSNKELRGSIYCGSQKDKACSYYFKVTGKDKAGNKVEYEIDDSRFKVDDTLPEITLDHYPEDTNDGYYNGTVSFKFTVTEQFALGTKITVTDKNKEANGDADEAYTLKETSGTYTVKRSKAGTYHLVIKAEDAFGNIETQNVRFTIDTEKPVVTLTGIPENGLTTGTKVTVTITDDLKLLMKDLSVTEYYKCFDETSYSSKKLALQKVDGKTVTTSATCGQRNGKACSYYFVVAGTDKAGNRVVYKTEDSRFRVDATNPAVTITPRPELTNDGYYKDEVAFDIAVTEQYAGAQIVVSDINKSTNGDADDTFTMSGTDGTYAIKRSAEGTYNLKVSVKDIFGNVTEEEAAFIIDTTHPTIGIATVNKLNNGNVSLNVDIADNYKGEEYIVHVVRKDSSGTVVYDQDYQKTAWDTKEAEPDLVFAEEGDYEITVSADDKAGNRTIAENVTFRIDKTAPVLSITGVADSQTTACTATLSVDEAFSFSYENAVLASADITATITKKTDAAATATIATLNTGNFSSGNPHTTTYTFDEDGEYTITFQARDLAGNTAAEVTKTFKVDKTAPEITVTAVDSKSAAIGAYQVVGGNTDSTKDYVDMNLEVKETFFASDKVSVVVHKDGKDLSSTYFQNFSSNAEVSRGSQRFEEDGVYTVSVTAEDALGNAAEAYELSFTVDNTPPSVESTTKMTGFAERRSEDGDLLLNSEDFADIKDKGYEALWIVDDTSVFDADVKLDGVDFVDFSDLSDGYHEMTITVTDELGHVSSDSFDFTYDGTAPRIIISGVDDKSTVNEPFTMTISLEDPDDVITEIVINGKTIDPSLYESTNTYEYAVEERGSYEVKVSAKDTAGNVASTYDSETGEVFSFHLGQRVSVVMIVIIIIAILLLLAVIVLLLLKRRKKEQN